MKKMIPTGKVVKEYVYIIYDSRAIDGDTESATVLVACDDITEVNSYKGTFGDNCAVYRYEVFLGGKLINEKFIKIL